MGLDEAGRHQPPAQVDFRSFGRQIRLDHDDSPVLDADIDHRRVVPCGNDRVSQNKVHHCLHFAFTAPSVWSCPKAWRISARASGSLPAGRAGWRQAAAIAGGAAVIRMAQSDHAFQGHVSRRAGPRVVPFAVKAPSRPQPVTPCAGTPMASGRPAGRCARVLVILRKTSASPETRKPVARDRGNRP